MGIALSRNFWRLWTSSISANLTDGIVRAAVPLLAAALTRDPLLVSLVSACSYLPWLVLALPSGALVDRIDRRRAMALGGVARGVILGLLALALSLDMESIWILCGAVLAVGAIETVYDSAARAILPAVVPAEELDAGNGRLFAAEVVGEQFLGPPAAGVLFAIATTVPFAFGAGGYAVAAALIVALKGSYRPAEAAPPGTRIVVQIAEGCGWLRHNRVIRCLTIYSGILSVTYAGSAAVLVLFATEILDLGASGFGVLLGVGAVGSVVGSLTSARLATAWGRRRVLLLSLVVGASAYIGFGLTSHAVPAALLFAFGSGMIMVWNTITMSLRQSIIPSELFGRVFGVYRVVVFGSMPIGAALGGLLAKATNLRAPFFVAAAGQILVLLLARRTLVVEVTDAGSVAATDDALEGSGR